MKAFIYLSALLIVGGVTAGCGDNTVTAPSPASSVKLTATLLPASEVPPVSGSEANASGTAAVTLNLTKDSSGYVTAANLDVTVSVTGFPAGTSLTMSHIHDGVAGTNAGVFVSFGLTAGEVSFPNGSGSFTKQGVTLTSIKRTRSSPTPPGSTSTSTPQPIRVAWHAAS